MSNHQDKQPLARLLLALLALTFVCPPAALWQCAHATQTVRAWQPTAQAMPCRMGGMASMPCCAPEAAPKPRKTPTALRQPPCHPRLVATTASPALAATAPAFHISPTADGPPALPAPPAPALLLPTGTLTSRGPPDVPPLRPGVSQSVRPRAPPAA